MEKEDGGLYHTWKNGKASINGFLEDYCFFIDALIELYQATFNESHLDKAKKLTEYALRNFYSEEIGTFYFTSKNDRQLIARKTEIHDSVIPSSNSVMANNLYNLGNLTDNLAYIDISKRMYGIVSADAVRYPSAYSNWGILGLKQTRPQYNIAISGKDALEKASELKKHFLPNTLLAVSSAKSGMPLLKGRFIEGKTNIYVCTGNACKLPVDNTDAALEMMQND
jgi:uncharacterized protein YyaL (SSP411 family)